MAYRTLESKLPGTLYLYIRLPPSHRKIASPSGGPSLRVARVGCLSGLFSFCEFDSDPGSFFPISFAVPPLTTRNQLAISRVGPCQYGRISRIRRFRLMPHRTATIGVSGKIAVHAGGA